MPPTHDEPAAEEEEKKKEGNAAKYITRTKAIKYLQVSPIGFRNLCMFRGIFDYKRKKKKSKGIHKTYYRMEDIILLSHEPLLQIVRSDEKHQGLAGIVGNGGLGNMIPTFKFVRCGGTSAEVENRFRDLALEQRDDHTTNEDSVIP